MTTHERQDRDDVLQRVQRLIASSDPDKVRRLLDDIRNASLTNKDLTETVH